MPFWRRQEPFHERLAREAGLRPEHAPHDPGPAQGEVGIHGIHRPRQWDAVATVDAPDVRGERALFVILPDSSLLIEDYEHDDDLSPLAVQRRTPRGSSAGGGRAHERHAVGVGARRIRVEEIPEDIAVDDLELTVRREGERVLSDGERIVSPSIERLSSGGKRDPRTAPRRAALGGQFATLRCPCRAPRRRSRCQSRRPNELCSRAPRAAAAAGRTASPFRPSAQAEP